VQLQLRDLDSTATSFRALHDTFVQRYLQAVQQQSFPISDARVISPAMPPRRASAPRGLLLGLASIVVGFGAGIAFALFRELGDERVRTARDLKADAGVDCIGLLPAEDRKSAKKSGRSIPAAAIQPDASVPQFNMPSPQPMMSLAIRQPFSMFGETCRNVKVTIDVARMLRPVKTVGIISASPSEGKTSTTANIGLALARAGSRVLVIDADLRKPKMTQTLMPDAQAGLVEVVLGQRDVQSVLWREASTGCYFLPAVLTLKLSNTGDLLSSKGMQELLARVSKEFDYVFLDCAPINPVSDVRASAHLIDGFILLAAWGETKRDSIARAASSDYLRDKLLGTLLTKVNMRNYRLFESYDDSYYSYEYVRS
jgi:polysaccharide biosynthesis transport protein